LITNKTSVYARMLSIIGMITTLSFFGYFGYTMITNEYGPVVIGRPLPWFILQLMAFLVFLLVILLAISFWQRRSSFFFTEKVRFVLLISGGILFIPWAIYWQLLSPF